MVTSMRRCVVCDDLWPWPISSRSFDLDFESCVGSVMFSVLDRLFPYLPQIITTIRGCVTCWVYNKFLKFQFVTNFSHFLAFTLKQKSTILLEFFHIWHKSSLASKGVLHVMPFNLDLYLQGHSIFWLWKSCPLCNVFSSGSIISIFATNNHYHQKLCRVLIITKF